MIQSDEGTEFTNIQTQTFSKIIILNGIILITEI